MKKEKTPLIFKLKEQLPELHPDLVPYQRLWFAVLERMIFDIGLLKVVTPKERAMGIKERVRLDVKWDSTYYFKGADRRFDRLVEICEFLDLNPRYVIRELVREKII